MRLSSSSLVELIRPVGLCFAAVLVTTSVLSMIDSLVPTEHLMLGYLLPTILVAIYLGSTLAVLTSFAGGLSAAYFLLPPEFSFYIDDPVHIAELGFTILLAVIASKVVGALASDSHSPKFDNVCVVVLGAVDHDAIMLRGGHHRRGRAGRWPRTSA
jgi:K+-sensing histidine kinase KdpD